MDENEDKNLRKNRRLLKNFLFGNPQSKALAILILEGKLDKIDFLEKEIENLKSDLSGSKFSDKVKTKIIKNIGYLIFCGENIPIGKSSTGKFKLLQVLGNENFGTGKTLESVFDSIKTKKDKNKYNLSLESKYLGRAERLKIIKNQVKEINRAIGKYIKHKKIKEFPYRLATKDEGEVVWLVSLN